MFQSFASSIVALMLYDRHKIEIKAFLAHSSVTIP